jgi:hypothetical protein
MSAQSLSVALPISQRVPQIPKVSEAILSASVLLLRAAACAAALHAAITGAVSNHQGAAELAGRCVAQADDLTPSLRCIAGNSLELFPVRQFEKDSLLALQESKFEPAKQVIHE